jgi:hypothetical protein
LRIDKSHEPYACQYLNGEQMGLSMAYQ